MTAFPAGRWSLLLIGHQWPRDQDLAVLSQGAINRGETKTHYSRFADTLRGIRTGPLSGQSGLTIDDLRTAFSRGEDQALGVAETSSVKETAYRSAYQATLSLQHELAGLAEDGNTEIESIENSEDPTPAKVAKITAVIARCQALANLAAAKYGGNIIDAIQRVLDAEGKAQSARQFCERQGACLGELFRPPTNDKDLSRQVEETLREPRTPAGSGGIYRNPTSAPQPSQNGTESLSVIAETGYAPSAIPLPSTLAPSHVRATDSLAATARVGTNPTAAPRTCGGIPPVQAPTPPSSAQSMPVSSTPPPIAQLPTPPGLNKSSWSANIIGGRFDAPTPNISPTELAQSFNRGLESGAPLSGAAHAMPSVPVTTTEPQISHAAPTIPSAAPSPQAHISVVDSTPVHHTPVVEAPPAAPIVAAPQPISTPVTPQPVGTLPTYGSDLKIPASTTTAPSSPPSTPLPPPASPSSAPVTPSAGQSAANQPTVVRRTAPSPVPPHPPSTLGTQAVLATATGAAIGTTSAEATARNRLQRIVTTVARQQPRLAWAAGDHPDNTTLLVTDLASGWIPPGIDLPSAVTLLPPARRRGNLAVLLGAATVTASYTPIQDLPDDAEPISTSPRPRSAPAVSDLGWELSRATQWRDGLPRLAHTLAKAASAGTGVLDSEIDLLHEHLADTSKRVLDGYPDAVDTHDVGNWQLLAAIDALIAGDKAAANYHLAWFLAAQAT